MTFQIFFALVLIPLSILGLGLVCYAITAKQDRET